jgi:hypothetical protein
MADWLKSTHKRLFVDDGSGEMQISQGKIHEHLGMALDFKVTGELKIAMISHVKEIVKLFAKHDNSESLATTPAAAHMFKVNDDAESLAERQMTICHNFVPKRLFSDPGRMLQLLWCVSGQGFRCQRLEEAHKND